MLDLLPSDIQVSIFSRLSVKQVIRCSSIKKSFYQLIHSNLFVNTYNQKSQIYSLNPPLIFFHLIDVYSLHYEANGKELDELSPLPLPFRNPDHCRMVDCCYNSIVCIYDLQNKDVLLWNPYIRKSSTLPKPHSTLDDEYPVFGLGFVDQTSDFKILLLNHTNQAEIYSLKHNCWKIIANPAPFSYYVGDVVCVKGSLYWISRESVGGPAVLSVFDLKDEVFGEISLSDCWNGEDSTFLCFMKYTESSIVVYRDGERDGDYDIQVMDVINEKKWRKHYGEEEEYDVSSSPWIGTMAAII